MTYNTLGMRAKYGITKYLKNKLLILSIVVNILLIAGVGTIYVDSNNTKKQILDQQQKTALLRATPILTPTPLPSLTSTSVPTQIPKPSGPSERAVRASTNLWLYGSKEVSDALIAKWGSRDNAIKAIALNLDKDNTQLVEAETVINQILEDKRVQSNQRSKNFSCHSYYIGSWLETSCN